MIASFAQKDTLQAMSSDLVRSIYTVAKHRHAVEQGLAAEQSAAGLIIQAETTYGYVEDDGHDECTATCYDVHKTVDGTVQLLPSTPWGRLESTTPRGGFKFDTYNQAVGDYIAAQFLTDRVNVLVESDRNWKPKSLSELQSVWRTISIMVRVFQLRSESEHPALSLRCTAESLPTTVNTVLQAYAAGSFV